MERARVVENAQMVMRGHCAKLSAANKPPMQLARQAVVNVGINQFAMQRQMTALLDVKPNIRSQNVIGLVQDNVVVQAVNIALVPLERV